MWWKGGATFGQKAARAARGPRAMDGGPIDGGMATIRASSTCEHDLRRVSSSVSRLHLGGLRAAQARLARHGGRYSRDPRQLDPREFTATGGGSSLRRFLCGTGRSATGRALPGARTSAFSGAAERSEPGAGGCRVAGSRSGCSGPPFERDWPTRGPLEHTVCERTFCGQLGGVVGGETPFFGTAAAP